MAAVVAEEEVAGEAEVRGFGSFLVSEAEAAGRLDLEVFGWCSGRRAC